MRVMRTVQRAMALAALGVLLAGCGDGDPTASTSTTAQSPSSSMSPTTASPSPTETTASTAPTTTTVTSAPPPPGSVINADSSEFGVVLFDENGQAIYLFDVETTTEPECYDQCAIEWPPVLTTGAPVAGASVSADLLGVTTRTDGSTQVTYAGHPLYTYAHEGPNEVLCHDFFEFGGTWFAIAPTGQPAPS